jgi:hypothetical protein
MTSVAKPRAVHETPVEGSQFAFTIPEFCNAHRISLGFFYELQKSGRAPRVKRIGARRIVTAEAAAAWRAAD